MPTDLELLDAWRAGDSRAGSDLFDRYVAPIHGFFDGKVPDHVVDDLVQRAFLACAEARERFVEGTTFRAYVFAVARNVLYGHYRRHYARPELDTALTSIADIEPSPSQIVAARAEHTLLLSALRQIPLDLQLVLELHYWEELTTNELAYALEIPQGTVKSRLRRAREALIEQMQSLPATPELLANTTDDLEAWARSLRRTPNEGS